MAEIGKYLYGIIPHRNGMPNFAELEGDRVYTILYQDIAAVVSTSKMVDYAFLRRDTLAHLLVKHQEIIERVMNRGYTIIPVKLGTFAVDETEVNEILRKGYRLIQNILEKVRDKIEVDLVATWSDFISVLQEAGKEKEIQDFKQHLLSHSSQITVSDQQRVGMMLKKVVDNKRIKYAERIYTSLKAVSQASTMHDLMDDQMIINTAFLLNRHEQKDFDEKLAELDTEFNEKVNFRCIGPLPAYSFYTLEIKRMEFGDVYWAKDKLGLHDPARQEDIKKAYQTKAFATHPDRNPDMPGIDEEFDEVKEAYTILIDYCAAVEQGTQETTCSFREDEFEKNAILVKVKK